MYRASGRDIHVSISQGWDELQYGWDELQY